MVLNGLNATINYFSKLHGKQALPDKTFEPYQLTRTGNDFRPNVILYFGESLNPEHMSSFGYSRETTPRLQALQQELHREGRKIYAAGILTRIATPMALAVVREPEHVARYRTRDGHLVSAAHDNGYQTLLTSSQTMDFLPATTTISDFDVYQDWQNNRDMNDADLPALVRSQQIDDSRPVFWLINNRAPHSPYDAHIAPVLARYSLQPSTSVEEKTINAYDDALRTTDGLMTESIKAALAKTRRPTLVIVTSDHGQLMNKNGQFGHGRLDMGVALSPLIAMWVNWPQEQPAASIACVANHYLLGKYLLRVMGYKLVNPNENQDKLTEM